MTKRKTARALPGFLALLAMLALCLALEWQAALYPQADGTTVYQKSDTTLDASNAGQGYVMLKHEETTKLLKVRVILGDSVYIYDLAADNEYETIPLTFGDGSYQFQVYRQVSGKRYTLEANLSVDVTLADETLPFLYPNQYVWYTADSAAVQKAAELCEGLVTDEEKLGAIRTFVDTNITYDYDLAASVQSGYIPVIDDVLAKGSGICFDYSCLTACMLRTQGIPTQLVIGYADTSYHAWNNVYLDGEWSRLDTTVEANNMKVTQYTEERIY
jgi:transglutaminase-like putative cysteine protease